MLNSIVQVHLAKGNTKAAFEAAERHLSKTKNQAGVYEFLGQTKMASKEYPKAIEYLEKAVELNPNLTSAYFLIANVYAGAEKI